MGCRFKKSHCIWNFQLVENRRVVGYPIALPSWPREKTPLHTPRAVIRRTPANLLGATPLMLVGYPRDVTYGSSERENPLRYLKHAVSKSYG